MAQTSCGSADAAYLRTLSIDEVLTRTDAVDTVHFLADALGSAMALTNPTGASTTSYTYEPYGRTTVEGTAVNPHQYTGRENDWTGLYYYRARYYQAALGRFVSEDPLGLAAGDANLYAYVRNQPATLTDPFGLWYTEAHGEQTVEVATACGLPPGDAEAAAGFNMAMDRNPSVLSSTSPQHAMPGSPRRTYTDRRLRRAMVLAAKGDRARAMRALGEGLHAIQDAWAHDLRTPQGTTTEHVFPKDRVHPDDPAQNPLWWKMSRQATAEYIKEYMRARGLKPTCD